MAAPASIVSIVETNDESYDTAGAELWGAGCVALQTHSVVEASPPPIGTTRGGHPNFRVKEIVDGERCSIADPTQCLGGDYGATNLRPFFPVKILEIFVEVRVYTTAEHSVISGTAYLDHDQD